MKLRCNLEPPDLTFPKAFNQTKTMIRVFEIINFYIFFTNFK